MKRIMAILLTIIALCVIGGASDPPNQDGQTGFDLISYLETHNVGSYEEFLDIIRSVSPESIDEDDDPEGVTYFDIEIDYTNMIVSVMTLREATYNRANGASNSVSRSYYASSGLKIFTIKVSGTFSYITGSCSTVSASGSYTRAFLSTWNSTPTISSGNITTSKAYARISGTATSGANSMTYALTLTCDDSGNFSSY